MLTTRPADYTKRVALVLQGGGALGSYQSGVYEALASSDYLPDWVAGISIGAINAALIAGNAPNHANQLGGSVGHVFGNRSGTISYFKAGKRTACAGPGSVRLLCASQANPMVVRTDTDQLL